MKKVVICNDEPFMLNILEEAIDTEKFNIVAEVSTAQELIHVAHVEPPDIVLLDLTLSGEDSLSTLGELKEIVPDVYVIMCAAMGQRTMIMSAIQTGASDFIVKPYEADRVKIAMNQALQNQ